MNKARKMVVVLLMAFGLVSVSFGAWIPEYVEANYQKLKAEVEMWKGKECKYNESGELVDGDIMCDAKNVIAFFDEIRATEVKGAKTEYDEISIAMRKVMEMPRFKEDIGIYAHITTFYGNTQARFRDEEGFWENVFNEWKKTKSDLKIRGIKGEYWEAVAKESE